MKYGVKDIAKDKSLGKKFSGRQYARGHDLKISPYTFAKCFQLRIDSQNIIWLIFPQLIPEWGVNEFAIAKLNENKSVKFLDECFFDTKKGTNGLGMNRGTVTLHFLLDCIQGVMGDSYKRFLVKRDPETGHKETITGIKALYSHVQKYAASRFCTYTEPQEYKPCRFRKQERDVVNHYTRRTKFICKQVEIR